MPARNPQCQGQAFLLPVFLLLPFCKQNASLQQMATDVDGGVDDDGCSRIDHQVAGLKAEVRQSQRCKAGKAAKARGPSFCTFFFCWSFRFSLAAMSCLCSSVMTRVRASGHDLLRSHVNWIFRATSLPFLMFTKCLTVLSAGSTVRTPFPHSDGGANHHWGTKTVVLSAMRDLVAPAEMSAAPEESIENDDMPGRIDGMILMMIVDDN